MENENEGELDTSTPTEDIVLETIEAEPEETPEVLKEKLAKATEYGENQKIRAEKAERKAKETVKPEPVAETISTKDILALSNAKVHEDDIDEVLDYAKYKKIPLAEALKSSVVKTLLSEKEEQRKVADATNVGATRRGSSKVSDEVLLDKASKGELPSSDEDMERLVRARKGLK